MKSVLFTSVCRPLGAAYGDGPSVGYELLHGQVTRAQGMFSPRSHHLHFSMEYVAENLQAPCVVLQYPSRRELIRELKKGFDYVGVSFILATFHRMKEVVSLTRKYAPRAKIILGGYGTVLPDEVLADFADVICREEGVEFMQRLLGEPRTQMPYRHPLLISRLKVFSMPVGNTGMIFAGLGCPAGCDFCCTSHFFKRRHIKLLPSGRDIHAVIDRYLEVDPDLTFVILDEDFLLNKRRAMELRDCVMEDGRSISIFAFASIRAVSQYRVEEILEMGIDGLWIGYEGTRAGFAKQQGRPVEEIFREFREHGITILASMILGMPNQDEETVLQDLDRLLELKPAFCQFMIYGPTPGTPLYEKVAREATLREDLASNPERYYRSCHGFTAMVHHSTLTGAEIEAQQRHCFEEDFRRLGPSIFRSVETWFNGYERLKESPNPRLRAKARWFGEQVRKAYPVFLAGRLFGPNARIRRWIGGLARDVHRQLGRPTFIERVKSIGAIGMAMWTAFKLRFGLFQRPRLVRHRYRWPLAASRPDRIWKSLSARGSRVSVQMRPESTVWVRLEGTLGSAELRRLLAKLRDALQHCRDRLVLDLRKLAHLDGETARQLSNSLGNYRTRIRIVLPSSLVQPQVAAWLALFSLSVS